ncbi:metal transporter CNNM4-like [Lineus longissimus]|uniref:metal transporter CNNM4-like n=1 Tax=Lineus longissimus TaxID=88925 RepID=UPI002B4F9468
MADGRGSIYLLLCISLIFCQQIGLSEQIAVPIVSGIRADEGASSKYVDGVLEIIAGSLTKLRIFGANLGPGTKVAFTTNPGNVTTDCTHLRRSETFSVIESDDDKTTALLEVTLQELRDDEEYYFICVQIPDESLPLLPGADSVTSSASATGGSVDMQKLDNVAVTKFTHQGMDKWCIFKTAPEVKPTTLMPIWLQCCLIAFLLTLSGLFSGLNLGLMALDQTELKVIEKCGKEKEKRYAHVIQPLRKRGNFLLCSLLLGNVLVNNTMTILLDDLTSGIIAVIGATLGIVIFGEIVPQSICSRHGLAVGAKTIWVTKIFMLLTFPLSFPISKLLDCILGEEIGQVYNREKLMELIKISSNDLEKGEIDIISGAMEFSKKTVKDVMTPLDDAYMISEDNVLDFETMSEIMKRGYSRIPVYGDKRSNIIALLNIKDLAFVDPDDKTPLKAICQFYNHPISFVYEDDKLDNMLAEFKKGHSHMAFVQRINSEGEGDPFYEIIGLLTLEDIIEEIIQAEIVDETDTITDNKMKNPRNLKRQDFTMFNAPDEQHKPRMSPQLSLATFQYLSTTLDPFKSEWISETVLQRLLKQDIVVNLQYKPNAEAEGSNENVIFKAGMPCDFFAMILIGRVQVEIGKEKLIFEGGPFMYFGVQALQGVPPILTRSQSSGSIASLASVGPSYYHRQPTYNPDFSVKALTDVQFLKIHRAHYVAAYRATLVERHPKSSHHETQDAEDPFLKEWSRCQLPREAPLAAGEDDDDNAQDKNNDSSDKVSVNSLSVRLIDSDGNPTDSGKDHPTKL